MLKQIERNIFYIWTLIFHLVKKLIFPWLLYSTSYKCQVRFKIRLPSSAPMHKIVYWMDTLPF